jgi:hypothetical protein
VVQVDQVGVVVQQPVQVELLLQDRVTQVDLGRVVQVTVGEAAVLAQLDQIVVLVVKAEMVVLVLLIVFLDQVLHMQVEAVEELVVPAQPRYELALVVPVEVEPVV